MGGGGGGEDTDIGTRLDRSSLELQSGGTANVTAVKAAAAAVPPPPPPPRPPPPPPASPLFSPSKHLFLFVFRLYNRLDETRIQYSCCFCCSVVQSDLELVSVVEKKSSYLNMETQICLCLLQIITKMMNQIIKIIAN